MVLGPETREPSHHCAATSLGLPLPEQKAVADIRGLTDVLCLRYDQVVTSRQSARRG